MDTEKAPIETSEPSGTNILRRVKDRSQTARIASAVGGAVLAILPVSTKANEIPVGTFGLEVNEMMVEECAIIDPKTFNPPPGTGSSGVVQGVKPERFRMIFDGVNTDCSESMAGQEFEVLDGLNNGITIRSLGEPIAMPEQKDFFGGYFWVPDSLIEVDRGDGKDVKMRYYGDDKIYKDGELKWDGSVLIDYGPDWGQSITGLSTIHPSQKPNHVKVVKFGSFYVNAWENDPPPYASWGPLVDVTTSININVPNYYDFIQQSINDAWEKEGKDPYEAGLLKHVEDGAVIAPETDTLLLAAGAGMQNNEGGLYLFRRNSQTDEYSHLQRNEDGTYTLENPQIGKPDWKEITNAPLGADFLPGEMVKVTTTNGRKIHLVVGVGWKADWQWYHPAIKAISLEELTDAQGETYFKEVQMTFEFKDQYPDDDEDGKLNHEDNCRWRANPDQINTTAGNYGDACSANCEQGGWPGVDIVPLQTNSSGLRICQSELGYDFAFSFEDGSTIHSNMDIEVSGGEIILKPGQKIRFILSWDPRIAKLSAPNISLPSGNSVKIKVHSAKNLDGADGQTIFTHDGISEYFSAGSDWQDFGIVGNGKIENASDIEIEVGNENPLPSVEQGTEAGAEAEAEPPAQQPEVETVAEVPAQAEPVIEPSAQVELPTPQPELVIVAEVPMPVAEPVAEPVTDVVESSPPETDAGSVIIPPPADVIVYIDTPPVSPDTSPDTLAGSDEDDQSNPEPTSDTVQNPNTDSGQDTGIDASDANQDSSPDLNQNSDTPQSDNDSKPDTISTEDKKGGTDTPVQGEDSEKPQPLADASQNADLNQPKQQPQEKSGGSGGCSCAIENPDDPSILNTMAVLGAVALAWVAGRRKSIRKVLAVSKSR